jgi:hypothetical protein
MPVPDRLPMRISAVGDSSDESQDCKEWLYNYVIEYCRLEERQYFDHYPSERQNTGSNRAKANHLLNKP